MSNATSDAKGDAMSEKVLECRGVCKSYHDGSRELQVLRGVDLTVNAGESMAIIGASGAGKSTLLHIMGTLDRPTKGEVWIRGKSVLKMSRAQVDRIRNEDIGFVFQFYHLLPEFTALENVMMPGLCKNQPLKACEERANELLGMVGLSERVTHKPGELSGGEQQRVAIARALFNRPGVLLADEPTGNLDERTGTGIIELLWELNDRVKATLVLVTHDERVAKQASRIVHLQAGMMTA